LKDESESQEYSLSNKSDEQESYDEEDSYDLQPKKVSMAMTTLAGRMAARSATAGYGHRVNS